MFLKLLFLISSSDFIKKLFLFFSKKKIKFKNNLFLVKFLYFIFAPIIFVLSYFFKKKICSTYNNKKHKNRPYIYYDVTDIYYSKNINNGISRVILSIYKELFELSLVTFEIIPIFLDTAINNYLFSQIDLKTGKIVKGIPKPKSGDIYLNCGISKIFLPLFYLKIFDNIFSKKNLLVVFTVHDLLPIEHSHWWPLYQSMVHKYWIQAIAIKSNILLSVSNETQKKLKTFLQKRGLADAVIFESVSLGSNLHKDRIAASINSSRFQPLASSINFLHVSTIEPRKGHLLLIKAFEILWKQNFNINLVLVGSIGWKNKKILDSIYSSPFLNKNLFWYSNLSDSELIQCYRLSDVVIHPSEAEGFGLSIVEGQNFKKYIICRNIPIFREVALGDNVTFFNTDHPKTLSNIIKRLLVQRVYKRKVNVKIRDWADTTKRIIEILEKNRWKQ